MLNRIKSFFIGSKLEQLNDYHERVRVVTNFHFSLVLLGGFLIALFPVFFSDQTDVLVLPVCSGLIFSVVLLFANKFIHSSITIGFIFVFLGWGVAFGNLFLNTEVLHIGTPLWIILVMLYSFYNLGFIRSLVVTILSFAVYVVWIVYFLQDEVKRVSSLINEITPVLVLEVSVAFVIIVAMISVYLKALTSREAQLTLKNKQLRLNQWSTEEEQFQFFKKLRHSMENHHKYFSKLSELQKKGAKSIYVEQQFKFLSVVYNALSRQQRYNSIDPGTLITAVLSVSVDTYDLKGVNYTVDNTIDFIEEKYVIPLSLVLTMLIFSIKNKTNEASINVSVNYFYEGVDVVFRYQDNCPSDNEFHHEKSRLEISNLLISDVGGVLEQKEPKNRSIVDIRFPL